MAELLHAPFNRRAGRLRSKRFERLERKRRDSSLPPAIFPIDSRRLVALCGRVSAFLRQENNF